MSDATNCPACNGTGCLTHGDYFVDEPCPDCDGSGHDVDCGCIYCRLDHMQERADQRNDERIDREMEEEK